MIMELFGHQARVISVPIGPWHVKPGEDASFSAVAAVSTEMLEEFWGATWANKECDVRFPGTYYKKYKAISGCRIRQLEVRSCAGDRVEATLSLEGRVGEDHEWSKESLAYGVPYRLCTWHNINFASELVTDAMITEFILVLRNNPGSPRHLSGNYGAVRPDGIGFGPISAEELIGKKDQLTIDIARNNLPGSGSFFVRPNIRYVRPGLLDDVGGDMGIGLITPTMLYWEETISKDKK